MEFVAEAPMNHKSVDLSKVCYCHEKQLANTCADMYFFQTCLDRNDNGMMLAGCQ